MPYLKQTLFILLLGVFPFSLMAKTPIFEIKTLIPAPSFVIKGREAVSHYTVKNSWAMDLMNNGLSHLNSAISQNLSGDDGCNQGINLPAHSSCILKLRIDADKMSAPITEGPRICHTNQHPVYCSDPFTPQDMLNIRRVETTPSIAPKLSITPNNIILEPDIDTVVTITNHSDTIAANNIDIAIKDSPFNEHIESDNNHCLHVPPKQQCHLSIRLKNNIDMTQTPLKIEGANTQSIFIKTTLDGRLHNEQHTLITDAEKNEIKICDIDTTLSLLSNCHPTLSTNYKINAINLSPSKEHAYLADSSNDTIQCCELKKDTGELAHCMNAANGFKHIDYGFVSFNRTGTEAYIPDGGGNKILLCQVDDHGMLNDCKKTGSLFHDPEALLLNKEQNQAYITNFSSDSVTHCLRHSDGTLSQCVEQFGFEGPIDLSMNRNNTLVYITNFQNHTVRLCDMASNGNLINCHATGNHFNQPVAIRLSKRNDYAYVVNSGVFGRNSISQCKIDDSGELFDCVNQNKTDFRAPYGLVLF